MNVTDTLQKLSEAAAGQGNAFKSIYEVALKATEQVFSLNTDFARSFFEGAVTYPASRRNAGRSSLPALIS